MAGGFFSEAPPAQARDRHRFRPARHFSRRPKDRIYGPSECPAFRSHQVRRCSLSCTACHGLRINQCFRGADYRSRQTLPFSTRMCLSLQSPGGSVCK